MVENQGIRRFNEVVDYRPACYVCGSLSWRVGHKIPGCILWPVSFEGKRDEIVILCGSCFSYMQIGVDIGIVKLAKRSQGVKRE